ncbi:sensor protein [Bifidobacterium tissieri]|uniref:histidine kinase n=2 Tax=Bifidobacterium tissieri TaxID=1630162 RepID=A0A261FGS2_9BIFI|nr:sensor protein [Bifidobacterium tissieri]
MTASGKPVKKGAKSSATRRENPLMRHLDAVSLSTKLVSIILVLLLVSGCVIAFAVRQLVSAYIIDKTDTQLTNQAGLVINNIDQLQRTDNSSTLNGNMYFVQFRDADYNIESTPLVPKLQGSVASVPKLPASGSLDGIQFGRPFTTDAQVQVGDGSVSRSSLKMAMSPWRVVALQYTVKDPDSGGVIRGVALIGLSLHDMQDTLGIITKYFLVVGIATIVFATVMATIAVDRTLLPLKRIEKTAAKITNGDLSQRVPSAPENTEVGSLSASLNQMLARIEQSFREQQETTDKMKRFVSDASHELRTPLAAIHGYAELYKMQRDYPGALERADESIDRIEKSSTRMAALVEDLLSLARMDEGRGIDLNQKVKLNGIIADSAEDLHALDPERVIRLGSVTVTGSEAPLVAADGTAPEPARLEFTEGKLEPILTQGDPARLRQVITNIVGNIHRYTPSDSPVEMGVSVLTASLPHVDLGKMPSTDVSLDQFIQAVQVAASTGSGQRFAVMRVIDHGPGMAPQSRQMIFERFYTADPSRAREKGGTGLGMAIAQSAVKAHHGLICASETDGGGLTFTVIIPIVEVEPTSSDAPHSAPANENPSESVQSTKA